MGVIGLPEQDETDQQRQIAAVRRWLENESGWLLILDNANEPSDLDDYRPRASGRHVLITSRNPNWGSVARLVSVPVLPRDNAIQVLLERTRQTDRETADRLAEELGDLPLALAQAVGYMESTAVPLIQYLELYRERRRDLWGIETAPDNYHATVATTWSLALEHLDEGSAELLRMCAFLGAEPIPRACCNVNSTVYPIRCRPRYPIDYSSTLRFRNCEPCR